MGQCGAAQQGQHQLEAVQAKALIADAHPDFATEQPGAVFELHLQHFIELLRGEGAAAAQLEAMHFARAHLQPAHAAGKAQEARLAVRVCASAWLASRMVAPRFWALGMLLS